MMYIIQVVALSAIMTFAIAAAVFGAIEVVRLFLEDLRGKRGEEGRA